MSEFDEAKLMSSLDATNRGLNIWIKRLISFEDKLMDEYHDLEDELEKKKREVDLVAQAIGDLKLAKTSIDAARVFEQTL